MVDEIFFGIGQWIGLRENLQETMDFPIDAIDFPMIFWGFPAIFPLNQSIDIGQSTTNGGKLLAQR